MNANTHVSSRDQASPQRRVGHDSDAELACSFEQPNFLVFYVKRERRVLDLNGSNRMNGMRAAQGCCRYFGETEILDLACSSIILAASQLNDE